MTSRGTAAWTRGLWLCVALACAACGSGTERVGYRSGSRLRARVLEVDGARQFVGFHDRVLDVDCSFGLAEDGVMRCLPDDVMGVQYADPACTTPIGSYWVACPSGTPKYAAASDVGDVCGQVPPSSHYYTVGHVLSATTVFNRYGTTCTPENVDVGAPLSLFTLAPVPASTFVAAGEQWLAHGAVGSRVLVADDGSRVTVGLYDVARAQPCAPFDLGDGGPKRCLPGSRIDADGVFFADAQCTQQVAFGIASCTPSLVIASKWVNACSVATLFAVGAPVDPNTISEQTGGGCVSRPPLGGAFFALDAPMAPDAFPALRDLAVGSGPVRVRAFANDAGWPLDFGSGALVLAATGRGCTLAPDTSGVQRCVEDVAGLVSAYEFADADCARAAVIATAACPAGTPRYAVHYASAACRTTLDGVFALGAPLDATFTPAAGVCMREHGWPGYEVGAPLDLSVIPAVQTLTE